MDKVSSFGSAIRESLMPTLGVYALLLEANASSIRSTLNKTFTYGPHTRQELDVYYPPPSSAASNSPVLIFLHGGGFVAGGKTVAKPPGNTDDAPAWASGLAYANVGHFFASKHGITTVVANYRVDRHGAVFPSGGEDCSLVIKWIQENLLEDGAQGNAVAGTRDLFLLGNSAGSIHMMTYLFHDDFAEHRTRLMSKDAPVKLKAAVSLSGPLDLEVVLPHRAEVLNRYFKDDVKGNLPQSLINRALQKGDEVLPGVRVLIADCEFDPQDEVIQPSAAAAKMLNGRRPVDLLHIPGHNHHSSLLSLGTNIEKEEAWGHTVARWLKM